MGGAALVAWPALLRAMEGRRLERIGLQLYTVRNHMESDPEGTLAKVAAIGYQEVEFAGYFGRTPKEVRAMLGRHGLRTPSGHVGMEEIRRQWDQVLEGAHIIGQKYVVCPSVPESERSLDHWKRHAALFNRAGEASRKAGIQFAYHCHDFEFERVNGKLAYDVLLEATDPELVKMEMDLYWITKGGQDPLRYFSRYPGRFPLVHVKDMSNDPQQSFTDVGKGIIDFKSIFARSEQAGIRHYFVENDDTSPGFSGIRSSYEYLKQLRF